MIWVISSSIILAGAGAGLIVLLAPERAATYWFALAMVPLIGFMAVGEGTLKGLGKPALAESSRQLVVAPLLLFGVYFLSRSSAPEAANLLVVNLLAYAAVALAAITITAVLSPVPLRFERPNSSQLRPWAQSLVSFAMISGMTTLSTQFATIFLGFFGEPEQVAYLRVAERGAQLVAFPLLFINAVLGPKIVAAHRDDGPGALRALSRRAAQISLVMSAPMALLLLLFTRPLIIVTFGENYVDGAALPLIILVIGQVLFSALGSPALILAMTDHEHDTLLAQLYGLIALIILVASLAVPFGAIGAATGVAIGLVASKSVASLFLLRRFGFVSGPY